MREMPVDLFIEAMMQNDLDAVEQLARVLCRRDDVGPDDTVSIKRAGDKGQPPMMRGWMWYVEQAQEMLRTGES